MADVPVAQAVPAAPGSESNVVYGIAIDDRSLRSQVRRVLAVAVLMGLLAIITSIISLVLSQDYSAGFIASFAIPLCGYLAVKNKSRSCLRAFIAGNCVCAAFFIFSAILVTSSTIPMLECVCDVECTVAMRGIPSGAARANSTAWQNLCARKDSIIDGYYGALAVGGATAVLQLLGCIWGRQLEGNEYFAVGAIPDGVPVAMVGGAYHVQPMPGAYPPQGQPYGQPYGYYGPYGGGGGGGGGIPMAAPAGQPYGYAPSGRPGVMSVGGDLNYNPHGGQGGSGALSARQITVSAGGGGAGYPAGGPSPYPAYPMPYGQGGAYGQGGPTVAQPPAGGDRPRCEPA